MSHTKVSSEIRSGCSGLHHSRAETAQPLWATCTTDWLSLRGHIFSDCPRGTEVFCKAPPEPPLLQTEQVQLPQPLLTGLVLQTHHLRGLLWTTAGLLVSVLYWIGRCGLTNSEWRGKMTPLDLWFCSVHTAQAAAGNHCSRTHCWPMSLSLAIRTHRAMSSKLVPRQSVPACAVVQGSSIHGAGLRTSSYQISWSSVGQPA